MNYMINLCIANRDKELCSNVFFKSFPKVKAWIIKSKNFENSDKCSYVKSENMCSPTFMNISKEKIFAFKTNVINTEANYSVDIVEDLSRLHSLSEFKFFKDLIQL